MEKKPDDGLKPIRQGIVSNALFQFLYQGVPAMMAWIATVFAYLVGYSPIMVIIIGGLVLLIFVLVGYFVRIQKEKRHALNRELPNQTAQELQAIKTSAAAVEKLENRITELEAKTEQDAEIIEQSKTRIEELEKESQILKTAEDFQKNQLTWHKAKSQWLHEAAEKEREKIGKFVVVERCTVSLDSLSIEAPYIVFDFHVFNGSVYKVSVVDSVSGFIKFKGAPLDKPARIINNQMENCPLGERNYFRIRQSVFTDEDHAYIQSIQRVRQSIRFFRVGC